MPEHQPACMPENEEQRIQALHSLNVLDTEPEADFDRVTLTTAMALDTPMAFVSLVDRERQWFKSAQGLAVRETPRDLAFCSHVVRDMEILHVEDATKDERFMHNPLVTGEPNIRFYCGVPLTVQRQGESMYLGSLCVLDRIPRCFQDHEVKLLQSMGWEVSQMLDQYSKRSKEPDGQAARKLDCQRSQAREDCSVPISDNLGVKVSKADIFLFEELRRETGFEAAINWMKGTVLKKKSAPRSRRNTRDSTSSRGSITGCQLPSPGSHTSGARTPDFRFDPENFPEMVPANKMGLLYTDAAHSVLEA
eukprot:CAMPEP_0184327738 /NCGR_PEP_ID=MMETSP1049-20130417/143247_1 /TAXON_ID=77928 /ORGANISM="Proteomonas sulcata, Strain CCMP704" /LENGTH=306 /DNA_ID=CAMNT_0026650007 /DNA_START=445 /DNA_END=1365 /DNA_ORIENTATION=-